MKRTKPWKDDIVTGAGLDIVVSAKRMDAVRQRRADEAAGAGQVSDRQRIEQDLRRDADRLGERALHALVAEIGRAHV